MTSAGNKRSFGRKDLDEFRTRMAELREALTPPSAPGSYRAHTDGACLGNPEGPGGWAAVVEVDPPSDGPPWLLFGHLSSTSNNRAEALGVLGALEWAPPESRLAILSDSELTVRILGGQYKVRANTDIWEVIRATIDAKRLVVSADWLRGHAGDPRNELADRLSKLGALEGRIEDLGIVDLPEPDGAPPELAGLEARTDWEREFLGSVERQLRDGRALSPKQQAVIDRMRARSTRKG